LVKYNKYRFQSCFRIRRSCISWSLES